MTHVPLCSTRGCPHPSDPDWHRCFIDGCNKQEGDHQHFPKRSLAGKGAKIVAFLCRYHHQKLSLNQWHEGVYAHPDGSKHYYVKDTQGRNRCDRIIEEARTLPDGVEEGIPEELLAENYPLGDTETLPAVPASDIVAKASTKGRQALELASNVGEVKEIRDRAEALGAYAKAAHLGLQAQNEMADIKIRAERKAGQLLSMIERAPGRRYGTSLQAAIRSAGIGDTMAHRWQLEAEIPDLEYEAYQQACSETDVELTSAGVLRLVRALKRQDAEPEPADCPESATGEHSWKRICEHCGKQR